MQRTLVPSLVALTALALLAGAPVHAEGERRQELVPRFGADEIAEKLKSGGYVLLMRHMSTVRSPDSWAGVDYDDCATQRVLSDEGKRQARDLGEAFRKLGIPVGEILVSPYCRCRETAELAFGRDGTRSEVLSTWDTLPMEQKTKRGTQIRTMLDTEPPAGKNTVLVTHTGNLMWSLGLDSKPEGLVHVFKPTGLPIARPDYMGRIDPDAWRSLASLPEPTEPEAPEAAPDASAP